MTSAVAERVLRNDYEQTETLTLSEAQSAGMVDVHAASSATSRRRTSSIATWRRCPQASSWANASTTMGGSLAPSSP